MLIFIKGTRSRHNRLSYIIIWTTLSGGQSPEEALQVFSSLPSQIKMVSAQLSNNDEPQKKKKKNIGKQAKLKQESYKGIN